MAVSVPVRKIRKNYSKLEKVIDAPELIEVQRKSFNSFLQTGVEMDKRADVGLQAVFNSVFPIRDFNQTASLEFVSYTLDEPKYDVDECRQRGVTYAAPMRVVVRLVVWDVDEETGVQSIRDVKEQEVYFGEIPLMTETGTFIINGTERVIVSQLHRSPGVFYEHDKGKTHSSGKLLYSARVIPYRGSWLDFEFDAKDIVHVRIDRRRKLPATILLRALGYTAEELLNYFYSSETVKIDGRKFTKNVVPDVLIYQRAAKDVKDPKSGETIVKKGRRFTRRLLEKMKSAKIKEITVDIEDIIDGTAATDIVDKTTGEVVLAVNETLTEEKLEEIKARKIKEIPLLFIDELNVGSHIRNTLTLDKVETPDEAKIEIYRRLRPGDPSTIEAATQLFENLF